MFEHREMDDYEKYINERQQRRSDIGGSSYRDEIRQDRNQRNQRRKGNLNGVIGFILGLMTSFILVYVGFSFAFSNGSLFSLFTKRSDKLDYNKIEEKTYKEFSERTNYNLKISAEALVGNPSCPYCENNYALATCSCGGVHCISGEGENTCPWCNTTAYYGATDEDFNINRTLG